MKPTFILFHTENTNEKRNSVCHLVMIPVIEGKRSEPIEFFFNPETDFDFVMSGISESKVLMSPTFKEEWPKVQEILKKYGDLMVSSADGNSARSLFGTLSRLNVDFDPIEYCNAKSILRKILDEVSYSFDFLNFKYYNDMILDSDPVEIANRWCDHILKALENVEDQDLKTFITANRIKPGLISQEKFSPSKAIKIRHDQTFDPSRVDVNANPEKPFFGKNVVFTGKLERVPRNTARAMVVAIGGNAPERLTKETDYLVVGNQDLKVVGKSGMSGKMKQAAKYKEGGCNIEIINESDFFDMIED